VRLDLIDEEAAALLRLLNRAIDDDRYPLSPRVRTLRSITPAERTGSVAGGNADRARRGGDWVSSGSRLYGPSTIFGQHACMPDEDTARLALRTADQLRTDIANLECGQEFIMVDCLCLSKNLADFALTGGEGKKCRRVPHNR
jgi:hypothetical protein